MPMDVLVREAQGLPEELLMNVVRYARFLKSEVKPAKKKPGADGKYRKAGIWKGLLTIPDDFDEPLEDFAGYM